MNSSNCTKWNTSEMLSCGSAERMRAMVDMQAGLTCCKSTYYIQCRNEYDGVYIELVEGYVIRLLGDYYGFTRGVDGFYIISDCTTGARINDISLEQNYSLVAAYRALKKFASGNMARLERIRSSKLHREAVAMIREAYRRDFAEATGGGTNADA